MLLFLLQLLGATGLEPSCTRTPRSDRNETVIAIERADAQKIRVSRRRLGGVACSFESLNPPMCTLSVKY